MFTHCITDKNILQLWHQGKNQTEIRNILKVGSDKLRKVLLSNGVSQSDITERMKLTIGITRRKPIYQFDLNGVYVKTSSAAYAVTPNKHIRVLTTKTIGNNFFINTPLSYGNKKIIVIEI